VSIFGRNFFTRTEAAIILVAPGRENLFLSLGGLETASVVKSISSGKIPQTAVHIRERFRNQVALVVGGAQGIGKAIAFRLAREAAQVVIGDIDKPILARTVRELSALGDDIPQPLGIPCDVRKRVQVDRMVAEVVRRYRRADILMYVAGVGKEVPFVETSEEHWDRTLDVNLKGAFLSAVAVVPHMIKQRYGKLVFIASTNSWDAEAQLAPYNASKAGVFLLAKTLARELGHFGINSNAVGPGLIRTRLTAPMLKNPRFMRKYRNLIPLGRIGQPEDIAGPATFLASRDADYINGVLLFVDGGQLA
jgi:NAD(P)-dependent dehydrogenase (short-subunit alcohol dehydrogenase family)